MPVKPKPPISDWIVRERKRMGWKPVDVSERLKAAGYEAEVSTVQVWEAGRAPKAETIAALEKLFGSVAPREMADSPLSPESYATLLAKMDRQTDAIESVAKALLELIVRMDRDQRTAGQEREQIAELLGVLARAQTPEETPSEHGSGRPSEARPR